MATTGKPPYYKNKKQMQDVIDQYFRDCAEKPILDEDGNAITDKHTRTASYN